MAALSLEARPTQVVVPGQVMLSGRLTDAETGSPLSWRLVRLYWLKPGAEYWERYGAEYTDEGGSYVFTGVPIKEVGAYQFYAEWPGDALYPEGARSSTVTVRGLRVAPVRLPSWLVLLPFGLFGVWLLAVALVPPKRPAGG